MNEPDDTTLRRWLLHRLPDAETGVLEARLLEDDALGDRLRAIETDLLDEYARHSLDADDRVAVARWLLATPADRMRLRIATALAKLTGLSPAPAKPASVRGGRRRRTSGLAQLRLPSAPRDRQRRIAVLAFAAAAVVLAAFVGYRRHGDLVRPSASPFATAAPTITLLANVERGAADAPSAVVRIPLAAPRVRLQLEVADASATAHYTLRIHSAEREIYQAGGLPVQQTGAYRFVEVMLAPQLLASADYRISLSSDASAVPVQAWTLRTHTE